MIQQQRENAERNVDQKIEDISGRLQQMKDELSGTSAGLQGQIDEVDRAMRAAFEGIGASLSPRRIALRSGTTVGTTVTSGAELGSRGGVVWVASGAGSSAKSGASGSLCGASRDLLALDHCPTRRGGAKTPLKRPPLPGWHSTPAGDGRKTYSSVPL